jgi:hypothetical protein
VTISISVDVALAASANEHLDGGAERIGFYLTDFDGEVFTLREWRAMNDDEVVLHDGHAALTDEAATAVIQWARDAGKALVEVHSHGRFTPAAFSRIDVAGLADWVPGVRWRLGGAPYAAMVTALGTVDAWAWIGSSPDPVQIDTVTIGKHELVHTTGETMRWLRD